MKALTQDQIKGMNKTQLLEVAKQENIAGRWDMTSDQLREAISKLVSELPKDSLEDNKDQPSEEKKEIPEASQEDTFEDEFDDSFGDIEIEEPDQTSEIELPEETIKDAAEAFIKEAVEEKIDRDQDTKSDEATDKSDQDQNTAVSKAPKDDKVENIMVKVQGPVNKAKTHYKLVDENDEEVFVAKNKSEMVKYCTENLICNAGWVNASLRDDNRIYVHPESGKITHPKNSKYTGVNYKVIEVEGEETPKAE